MDDLEKLMEAPPDVLEMTVGAAIGHGLLLMVGLLLCLIAGIAVERGSGALLLAAGALVTVVPAELRFYRALSASDAQGNWIANIVFVVAAAIVGLLAWRVGVAPGLLAGGTALASMFVAKAIDGSSEFLAGIPLGWIPAIVIIAVAVGVLRGKIKI
ncbi:hypothetical protein GCM10028787_31130 [Brachybacterium horti]